MTLNMPKHLNIVSLQISISNQRNDLSELQVQHYDSKDRNKTLSSEIFLVRGPAGVAGH